MTKDRTATRSDLVPQPDAPPEQRLLPYEALPARTFRRLPRERTLAVLAVSPLEVHGPHLPLGTDPLIGSEIGRRAMLRFLGEREGWYGLTLPPLCMGPDTVAHPGTVEVSHRLVRDAVVASGAALARAGLRGLVLTNFHGGPRHVVALERACRVLRKRFPGFLAVSPVGEVFGRVLSNDPELRARLLARTGMTDEDLGPAESELHAGMMESAAVQAIRPEWIHPDWPTLPPIELRVSRVVGFALRHLQPRMRSSRSRLVRSLIRDVSHLLHSTAWLQQPEVSYVGAPAQARPELGDAFLDVAAEAVAELLSDLMEGRRHPDDVDPLWWSVRWLLAVPSTFKFQHDAPA